jgi:hypothetical protein
VDENQVFSVSVGVRNTGNVATTFKIELSTPKNTLFEETVLHEGESRTLTFSLQLKRGEEDITISLYAGEKLLDRKSLNIKVLYVDGEISEVGIPTTVEEAQTIEVPVQVRNKGNKDGYFELRLGNLSEKFFLEAGLSKTVTFSTRFYRGDSSVEAFLLYAGSLLDKRAKNFTVLYPELTLSLAAGGISWKRDENDLPLAVITLKYTVRNIGTGPARDVDFALNSSQTLTWKVSYIGAGQIYEDSIDLKTIPIWEEKGGFSYLAKFEARATLFAEYNGYQKSANFSQTIGRSWPETFYVTPNDPVVKEKLNSLLNSKKWYDLRTTEVYIQDWVGGTLTYGKPGWYGFTSDDINGNLDELCNRWYQAYGFWYQLPRETIMSGRGVCIDKAILYTTFMRALGYSTDRVYVVVGDLQPEGGHAWVALYVSYPVIGGHWALVETTVGGIGRVLYNFDKILYLSWDALVNLLGREELQRYREMYMFNDATLREVRGNWQF